MADTYAKASEDGKLPANARQIMYAARPLILSKTGAGEFDDAYFTQGLLVDYVNEHPDECRDWNVVWSDRGHFTEPHTDRVIGLGTLAARRYLKGYAAPVLNGAGIRPAAIDTCGPAGRYGAMFYIEKEGFDPVIAAAELASASTSQPCPAKA